MLTSSRDFPLLLKELFIRVLTLNYFITKKIIHGELSLKKSMKILDIGSGTGTISPLFSECKYVGIDIDEKLVDFSRRNHPFSFKTMDAQKLDFPDNSFDIVLISGVIHHLDDRQSDKVLKGVRRVLKRKGMVLVIEAIPPLGKYNFPGRLLRSLDEGHNIRQLEEYEGIFDKYLKINKSYKKRGGLVDYGVFALTK